VISGSGVYRYDGWEHHRQGIFFLFSWEIYVVQDLTRIWVPIDGGMDIMRRRFQGLLDLENRRKAFMQKVDTYHSICVSLQGNQLHAHYYS
jgi:hypothetical protein